MINIHKIRLFLVVVAIILVITRYFFWWPKLNPGDLAFYNDQEELTFQGMVIKEPESEMDRLRLLVAGKDLAGRVLVSTKLYPKYSYGDLLEIKCRLVAPKTIDDFSYDRFLAKDKVYSLCYQPTLRLVSRGNGNWFYEKTLLIRRSLERSIDKSLTFPESALLKATLFGGGKELPTDLNNSFSVIGITHIIAVSGSHIVIITAALFNLFFSLGLRRKVSFYLVTFCLIVFTLVIGWPASAVRAVIMGLTALLAQQMGRLNNSSSALVISALIMLIINPLILFYDVGFQLSFLATFGLIKFSDVIESIIFRLKLKIPEVLGLRQSLIMTMAAQITTLPIIIFHFGRLSLITTLANLLILPTVAPIMFLGFLAAVSGLISLVFSKIIFWLAWPLLKYFIIITEVLAAVPLASIDGLRSGPWFLVISYSLLLLLIYKERILYVFKHKKDNLSR